MKPNNHYSTHTAEFVRAYGPVHGFWTFLFERLNKILKSFNTNGHADGQLETTFFTEFHRTSMCSRVVSCILTSFGPNPAFSFHQTDMMARKSDDTLVQDLAQIMLKASNETRGTIANLSAWKNDVDGANHAEGEWSR